MLLPPQSLTIVNGPTPAIYSVDTFVYADGEPALPMKTPCGSGLARDARGAVFELNRADAFASRLAPTVASA